MGRDSKASRLAVLILTKNEEDNIVDCIRSASFADEIVVVDSGSTDRTKELAEGLGAKVVLHPMTEEGFAGQRNFALTQTTAEWVFYLDADERVIKEAVPGIQAIVKDNIPAVYQVERKNVVFGQMMHYGGHRPDYPTRLFPRTGIQWTGKVHEGVETDLVEKELKNCLIHNTYTTWAQYFEKTNHYTTLSAQSMFDRGKRVNNIGALSHGLFAFIKSYVLKQGVRDGYLGFVMSLMAAYASLAKYLKLKNLYRLEAKEK